MTFGALGFWILWKVDTKLTRVGLQARMEGFADQAVALAKNEFDVDLNYQLDTLHRLDEILEQFHQRHVKQPIAERDLSRIVLTWGGYLGIAIQKRYGGEWQNDSLVVGKNTFPIRFGEQEAVPVMWCLRRIRKGADANLVAAVKTLVAKLDSSIERTIG